MLGLKTVAVILAAGESSRMGETKQLLNWQGKTLLEVAILKALNTQALTTSVVLGANKDVIIPKIHSYPIEIVYNENWKSGLLGSIQEATRVYKEFDSLLFILPDQPAVTIEYLKNMINTANENEQSIIATKYQSSLGVPAIFKQIHFEDLLNLDRKSGGAQNYIQQNRSKTLAIEPDFPLYDIDTQEEYERYYKQFGKN